MSVLSWQGPLYGVSRNGVFDIIPPQRPSKHALGEKISRYYIHAKKSRSSKTDNPLHEQLETILKFAHSSYNKQKIHFHKVEQDDGNKAEEAPKRTGTPHRKKYRKPTRSIQISQAMHCPVCGCDRLAPSQKTTERILVDLTFTQHGVRKSVATYW